MRGKKVSSSFIPRAGPLPIEAMPAQPPNERRASKWQRRTDGTVQQSAVTVTHSQAVTVRVFPRCNTALLQTRVATTAGTCTNGRQHRRRRPHSQMVQPASALTSLWLFKYALRRRHRKRCTQLLPPSSEKSTWSPLII